MATKHSTRAAKAQSRPSPKPRSAPVSKLSGINERVFLDIIEGERTRLIAVADSLFCIRIALQADQPPDSSRIENAVYLAFREASRVIEILEEEELLRAAQVQTSEVEKTAEEARS